MSRRLVTVITKTEFVVEHLSGRWERDDESFRQEIESRVHPAITEISVFNGDLGFYQVSEIELTSTSVGIERIK